MDNVVAQSAAAATALFNDNKTVAIGAALVNTYLAITKALSSTPPPFSYALAAATAAQGFAQVNAIRAQKREFGGSVVAGQPYIVGEKRPELFVPNQSGRIIPQVPVMGGRQGASSGSETLVVKGFDVGKFFEGDQMRVIADKMLVCQRNGGQVVLA